jgi:hypothetical protein
MARDLSTLTYEQLEAIADSEPSEDGHSPSEIAEAIRRTQNPNFGVSCKQDNQSQYPQRFHLTASAPREAVSYGYSA